LGLYNHQCNIDYQPEEIPRKRRILVFLIFITLFNPMSIYNIVQYLYAQSG
jgi:hypothetical protein